MDALAEIRFLIRAARQTTAVPVVRFCALVGVLLLRQGERGPERRMHETNLKK
jgi:hypothetical protein